MLILSRVCAEFHDKTGAGIFSITPQTRLTFQEAPEAIREDPLFRLLLDDRSIEVSDNGPRKKQLENDPMKEPEKPESAKTEPSEKAEQPAQKEANASGVKAKK